MRLCQSEHQEISILTINVWTLNIQYFRIFKEDYHGVVNTLQSSRGILYSVSTDNNYTRYLTGYQHNHKHDLKQNIQSIYLHSHHGKLHYQTQCICPKNNWHICLLRQNNARSIHKYVQILWSLYRKVAGVIYPTKTGTLW